MIDDMKEVNLLGLRYIHLKKKQVMFMITPEQLEVCSHWFPGC